MPQLEAAIVAAFSGEAFRYRSERPATLPIAQGTGSRISGFLMMVMWGTLRGWKWTGGKIAAAAA
jgi:hypothetical protein